jgi:acyl carrier protein
MTKDEIRGQISEEFLEIFTERNPSKATPDLSDDIILLASGLDSLGFAVLVAALEERFDYDPFTESSEAYYPQTFGEFVEFYFQNQP